MDFKETVDWRFPIPILYGPGRIKNLPDILKDYNLKSPLIVTDKNSSELPFIKEIIKNLNNFGVKNSFFSGISPNPVDYEIINGKEVYENGNHDSIIAIGGGSGMDGGKAISLLVNRKLNLLDFDNDKPALSGLNEFPPIICIPTTSGTGAETESTAMVTNSELGMKQCVWHPNHKPIAAILDPELTIDLPINLTSWTGVDALVHAIESYSINSLYSVADGMAIEALSLISEHLPKVVKDPNNVESRGAMLIGSCLAGISFLKGLGLVHAISHMVGAVYNTQHGLTNAILLPAILKFNEKEISHKINRMHFAMYSKNGSFEEFYLNICNLLDELEIPKGLKEINVGDNRVNELAQKSLKDAAALTNPRKASIDEVEKIISTSLTNAR